MFDARKAGEKIAELRKEKGMTQEELAEIMGVSSQAVSKWENGNAMPEVALLTKLSKVLNCSVDNILHPGEYQNKKPNYIHMLLPYADVDPYTGAWWPRSMAFPAVMTALKLFMGLEERRNFNNHQINDDQEYILQGGLSLISFGYSYYFNEFNHDCFNIYGLDYKSISIKNKSITDVMTIIKEQIQKGYPVILRNNEYNGNYFFVTGYLGDGNVLKAHEFMEGFEEKNCNMNPYEMNNMDNWLKPDMTMILLEHSQNKLSLEQACKNALYNYCLLMTGKLKKEEFCGNDTPEFFKQYMGYGSVIINRLIELLRKEERENVDSLNSFFPQDCILHESNYRTFGFLNMCKEYIRDLDKNAINNAIDRYKTLSDHSMEICNIMGNRTLIDSPISEKRTAIINYLVRTNDLLADALNEIKKAINFN